jgi:N6-adenosine-specific RNA methylase IME4
VSGGYTTIVADPPWEQPKGGRHNGSDGRASRTRPSVLPYRTMTLDEITAVPVDGLAARSALLYLWVTNAHIEHGYELARRWGFAPSVLLTWCKSPAGLGLGGRFVQTTEHVLFARRGAVPVRERANTTWLHGPRGEHSRKPDAFMDLVERTSPGPYLELWARRQRLGWDTWGNEALEHVEVCA